MKRSSMFSRKSLRVPAMEFLQLFGLRFNRQVFWLALADTGLMYLAVWAGATPWFFVTSAGFFFWSWLLQRSLEGTIIRFQGREYFQTVLRYEMLRRRFAKNRSRVLKTVLPQHAPVGVLKGTTDGLHPPVPVRRTTQSNNPK